MYKKGLVFSAACLGMLIFGIVLISIGSILPALTSKFSLNEISTGTLASLLPFGILIGSIIFGPIVDKYGYKNLLIICSFLVFIGLEGIALSNTFYLLQISIFLIGFGGGILNGVTNALVSDISTGSKGANLSLLGVFFGIGALGMPIVLGLLLKYFSQENIIAGIGILIFIPILFFISIKFPTPKLPQGIALKERTKLLREPLLILFGFVLFFESGMEGLVNNWTTTYLQKEMMVNTENALFALSYFVIAMTVTRLVLGKLLKQVRAYIVLFSCLGIALTGTFVMMFTSSYTIAIIGLVLLGIGFAAGFPIVLGYVGEVYSKISGTAFSFVLVIALIGNMAINYLMGIVAHSFGLQQFTVLLLVSIILMSLLVWRTLKKNPNIINI